MLAAAIIVFREVIEAGLIVGVVLAVTQGVPRHGAYVAGGIVAGLLGAGLVALFAGAISDALEGSGQEIFNAGVLALAVVMLTWHNVWMASHGRQMASDLRAMGAKVQEGSTTLWALAVVVAIAVLREGSEVVLFLYGALLAESGSHLQFALGGVLGLALGAGLTALSYWGLVHIPARFLFAVTGVLVALLAAGMAAQCVAFLAQAGLVTALDRTMWDTSWLVTDDSLVGRVLHTLVGYTDQPTAMQLVFYAGTLAAMFGLTRLVSPTRSPQAQSA